jgi:hypothetical protein
VEEDGTAGGCSSEGVVGYGGFAAESGADTRPVSVEGFITIVVGGGAGAVGCLGEKASYSHQVGVFGSTRGLAFEFEPRVGDYKCRLCSYELRTYCKHVAWSFVAHTRLGEY